MVYKIIMSFGHHQSLINKWSIIVVGMHHCDCKGKNNGDLSTSENLKHYTDGISIDCLSDLL